MIYIGFKSDNAPREKDDRTFQERLTNMNLGFVVSGIQNDGLVSRFKQLVEDAFNDIGGGKLVYHTVGEGEDGFLVNVPSKGIEEFGASMQDALAEIGATLKYSMASTSRLYLNRNRNGKVFVSPDGYVRMERFPDRYDDRDQPVY